MGLLEGRLWGKIEGETAREEETMNGWLKWDGEILLWIQEHVRAGGLNGAMRAITHLGDAGAFWILLAVALLIVKRTRRLGAACASALAMGALATNVLLKNLVHRIRPYVALENLSILVSEPSDWSFPSGHATASFAAAWALFRLAPKKVGVPALLLAILIALSRLYGRALSHGRARRRGHRHSVRRDFSAADSKSASFATFRKMTAVFWKK